MIYLIGFMGSGKSTVAEQLSERLGLPFIEMDAEIEKQQNMKISDIFAKHGEAYFRAQETSFLRTLEDESIVSTGGGVIVTPENHRLLNEGTVVYLKASWETIVERLQGDTERPLWQGELEDKKSRFVERLPVYESLADHIVEVDEKHPKEIVEEIFRCLNH
ncbi:shikimate kinase [Halobacillus fulvus]|nr:shikimate kinase [Halobacillus fulvus]